MGEAENQLITDASRKGLLKYTVLGALVTNALQLTLRSHPKAAVERDIQKWFPITPSQQWRSRRSRHLSSMAPRDDELATVDEVISSLMEPKGIPLSQMPSNHAVSQLKKQLHQLQEEGLRQQKKVFEAWPDLTTPIDLHRCSGLKSASIRSAHRADQGEGRRYA